MNPIFYALDVPDLGYAEEMVERLAPDLGGIKLGLEFFLAHGAAGYNRLAAKGLPIFLDLKLHDIPNTVAGAVAALLPLKPSFMTLHAGGGADMMRAAATAAAHSRTDRPKLLAVTVLTSLDSKDLYAVGQDSDPTQQVVRLAQLAKENGMDGVICSPSEISSIRDAVGADFILMVPGIRPAWAQANDQKRTLTPRQACDAGANYLVIGRPITQAVDPIVALKDILRELA